MLKNNNKSYIQLKIYIKSNKMPWKPGHSISTIKKYFFHIDYKHTGYQGRLHKSYIVLLIATFSAKKLFGLIVLKIPKNEQKNRSKD